MNDIAPRPQGLSHRQSLRHHLPICLTTLKVASAAMLNFLGFSDDLTELVDRVRDVSPALWLQGMIVAGAGGALCLPGMAAVMTALPLIGVPIRGGSVMGSIRCTVSYGCHLVHHVSPFHPADGPPPWQHVIPVATVVINNGTNARLIAVRILAAGNLCSVRDMGGYRKASEKGVLGKVKN